MGQYIQVVMACMPTPMLPLYDSANLAWLTSQMIHVPLQLDQASEARMVALGVRNALSERVQQLDQAVARERQIKQQLLQQVADLQYQQALAQQALEMERQFGRQQAHARYQAVARAQHAEARAQQAEAEAQQAEAEAQEAFEKALQSCLAVPPDADSSVRDIKLFLLQVRCRCTAASGSALGQQDW